jgi:methylmalonyl-CoA mutase C-terminal domain/subunit
MNGLKCLLGMLGVDAHTKGIRTLARLLRDEGVEVVYIGEHNSPADMIGAAIDEDVDVIGVSFSVATYLAHVEALMAERATMGADHIPVIVGGLIHADDEPRLAELGVAGVFGPATTLDDVRGFMRELIDRKQTAV